MLNASYVGNWASGFALNSIPCANRISTCRIHCDRNVPKIYVRDACISAISIDFLQHSYRIVNLESRSDSIEYVNCKMSLFTI